MKLGELRRESDCGSVALELLVFGMLVPIAVVGLGLQLLGEQRSAMQAQQLARHAVRVVVAQRVPPEEFGRLETALANDFRGQALTQSASVSLTLSQYPSRLGEVAVASVVVNNHSEAARMLIYR
ncbi:MAG: hypothetical protein RIQ44_788 [Actinomycetota bacterium]|jgi:hypothetical protein